MTPSITDWLMVIITLVYVVATILICVFNGKSAKAAREQIEEAQKQQAQNMALQHYAMRREIIHKFLRKEYDDLYADIPLLFDKDLLAEFTSFVEQEKELNTAIQGIEQIEQDFCGYFKPHEMDVIIHSREDAIHEGSVESVRTNIDGISAHHGLPISFRRQYTMYISYIEQAKARTPVVANVSKVIQERMLMFIKNSLQ